MLTAKLQKTITPPTEASLALTLLTMAIVKYRQTYNTRRTKSENLNAPQFAWNTVTSPNKNDLIFQVKVRNYTEPQINHISACYVFVPNSDIIWIDQSK